MSTITLDSSLARSEKDSRPGLGRLTLVELRKMTDTRAGFWLLAATAGLMLTLVIVTAAIADPEDRTLRDLVASALFPATVLLPVVGILLVSSEWSQRTGMVTFSLVPHRSRVVAAKFAAGTALAGTAFLLAVAFGLLGAVFAGSDVDGGNSIPAAILGQDAVLVVTSMIMGLAFGAMLLSSPPAIVLYFGLPLGFQALAAIPGFEGPAGWLDGSRSLQPMTEEVMSGTEWARVGATMAVWVLLPVVIGLWRISRSEVR